MGDMSRRVYRNGAARRQIGRQGNLDIAGGDRGRARLGCVGGAYPLEDREGNVRGENLLFLALVALPLVVAICLGLSVRALAGWGSRW